MGYTRKSLGLGAAGGILIAMVIITSTYTYFTYGLGKLVILVKDPPFWGDATHVYIKVSEIEIHETEQGDEKGWITLIRDVGWINLAEVLETSKVLGEASMQAGKYKAIRLQIQEAKITVSGENQSAEVPSGKIQIVITHGGITVKAGQSSTLLIDFETRVTYSHGKGYNIVPKVIAVPIGNQ